MVVPDARPNTHFDMNREIRPPQTLATQPTWVRYQVVAALCAAAAIAYICRHWSGVAEAEIAADLKLTDAQLSNVMSWFFITYGAFQIPGGLFAHRFGGRTALLVVAVMWSLASVLAGFAFWYWALLTAILLGGVAQAGIFPACVSVFSKWMPVSERSFACGSLGSFMSVGAAISSALTGWLISLGISWRWIVIFYSIPGIIWAVAFYLWFRDRPSEHRGVNASELALIRGESSPISELDDAETKPEPTPWGTIFTSASMGFICGQHFFRALGFIFYVTWLPRYLKETRGVSTAESGFLATLPILAVVVGGILGGAASDWIFRRTGSLRLSRYGVATVCMVGCAVMTLVAYLATTTAEAMTCITAASFIAAFGGVAAYVVTIDLGGKHVPSIFGIMNMAGNAGAAVCPILVERFVRLTGGWDLVLLPFVGVYLLAALCWFLLIWTGGIFGPLPGTKHPCAK